MESSGDSIETFSPLVPVAETPETVQPTVDIPDERRIPLERHGTRRAKDSPGSIEKHIRGMCGEFAVAKFFGVPERVDTEIYEFGDPGFDLRIAGKTLDVKTVRPSVNNPCLMVGVRKSIDADYYVLVQELNASTYRIIGYAPALMLAHARVRRLQIDEYAAERFRVVEQQALFHLPGSVAGTNQFDG